MTLTQAIDFAVQNLALLTAIQQSLFSALSGLCALFGWTKASKVLGTFTSLDLGRLVRYAKLLVAARNIASKTTLAGILPILILLGCSGTLEEARDARINSLTVAGVQLKASPRPTARCRSLADREDMLGTGVALGTVLTGASGISTWPVEGDKAESALAITAASVGALTVAGEFYRSATADRWAEECAQ